jgi:hypothetical protein
VERIKQYEGVKKGLSVPKGSVGAKESAGRMKNDTMINTNI